MSEASAGIAGDSTGSFICVPLATLPAELRSGWPRDCAARYYKSEIGVNLWMISELVW